MLESTGAAGQEKEIYSKVLLANSGISWVNAALRSLDI